MTARKNFSFRYDWAEKIAHLPEEVQFEILTGTVAYAKNGEFPLSASAEARTAFEEFILPDFRKRAKAAEYRARAKARKQCSQAQAKVTVQAAEPEAEAPVPLAFAIPLSRAERRRRAREEQKKRGRKMQKTPAATGRRL